MTRYALILIVPCLIVLAVELVSRLS